MNRVGLARSINAIFAPLAALQAVLS